MLNYFQTLVVRDIPAKQARRTGREALAWMADELVIDDEPSPCVPGDEPGFRPAELWQSAIVEIDESFLELELNGVQLAAGRQVFDAGEYSPTPHCPACNAPIASDDPTMARWRDALDQWADGADAEKLTCPACAARSPIVEWRHDPPIGFGNLGLVFWNWPSLNREFISRLGEFLGRPVTLVEGKRAGAIPH